MGFTMCANKKCDKARECLRFVNESNHNSVESNYQSYSNFDECKKESGYEYFIEVKRLKVG